MFSGGKNLESIGKLFEEIKEYLELQGEFVKLDVSEKLTVILSTVLTVAVLVLLGFIVLLFCSFSLAYYLGEIFENRPLGFGLVAALVLVLSFLFYVGRNKLVIQPTARFVIKLILTRKYEGK